MNQEKFSEVYSRWKEPNLERPIRVNIIFPIMFFIICGFLVLMPVFEEPQVTIYNNFFNLDLNQNNKLICILLHIFFEGLSLSKII